MTVIINGTNTPTAGGVTYGNGTEYATTSAGSAGGVLYSAGSSAPAFTAAGTSGQVLTSAGASAPTWTTPSAGAMVFISATTVSVAVAQVDFTSGISSTYDDYLLLYEGVVGPTKPAIRVQKSGSFQSTGYNYCGAEGVAATPISSYGGNNSSAPINNANGISTSNLSFGHVYLMNANNATGATGLVIQGGSVGATGSSNYANNFVSSQTTSAATTGIRFFDTDANNITAGTFRLYGIQKS